MLLKLMKITLPDCRLSFPAKAQCRSLHQNSSFCLRILTFLCISLLTERINVHQQKTLNTTSDDDQQHADKFPKYAQIESYFVSHCFVSISSRHCAVPKRGKAEQGDEKILKKEAKPHEEEVRRRKKRSENELKASMLSESSS